MLDGFLQIPGIDSDSRRLEKIRIRARGSVIEISSSIVSRSRKLRRYEKRPSSSFERHVAVRHVRRYGATGPVRVDGICPVLPASGRRAPCAAMGCGRNRRPVVVTAREY